MKPSSPDINPSLTFRSSHSDSLRLSLLICFPEDLFFCFVLLLHSLFNSVSRFPHTICTSLLSASGQRNSNDPHMQEAENLEGFAGRLINSNEVSELNLKRNTNVMHNNKIKEIPVFVTTKPCSCSHRLFRLFLLKEL